ncbi:N-acetyltransferase cml2 [Globisporangium polare]
MSSARANGPHHQQPQIAIRQFQDDDRAAVSALFVDGFPSASPEESQLLHAYITSCLESDLADVSGTYIAPGGNFWVATTTGTSRGDGKPEVAGMVALKKQENGDGELCRMSVKKEFRRYGIGKLLVEELERWAKESEFKTISLWTGEEMAVAQQFYKAVGYEKRSERAIPEDPDVTVFEFAKQLAQQAAFAETPKPKQLKDSRRE